MTMRKLVKKLGMRGQSIAFGVKPSRLGVLLLLANLLLGALTACENSHTTSAASRQVGPAPVPPASEAVKAAADLDRIEPSTDLPESQAEAAGDSPDLSHLKTKMVYEQDFSTTELGRKPADAVDDSGWAGGKVDMKVVATGDPKRPHAVECTVNSYGQIAFGRFQVEKGKLYRIRLDVAAKGGSNLLVIVRTLPWPWTFYLQSEEKAMDDYRTISFLGRSPKDGKDVCVQVVNRGSLSMRISNIKVEEVEGDVVVEAPPVPGNLVLNGSFELAGDGMFVRAWGSPSRPAYPRVNDAVDGNHVAELYDKNAVSTPWMPLSFQCEYRVRAHARAIASPGRFNLSLVGNSSGWKSQSVDLKPEDGWRTVSFKVQPQRPDSGKLLRNLDAFVVMSAANGPVQVDAVEVVAMMPGNDVETQAYQPHAPLELAVAVDPSMPMAVATVGDPVPVKVLASADITAAKLQILDEHRRLLREQLLSFKDRRATVVLRDLPPGYWCLRTAPAEPSAESERVEGESFLCVVPVMPDVPADQWIYGSHIVDYPPLRQAAWKLGLHWDRLHDTGYWQKWDRVQPDGKDSWNFHDDWINARRKDGFTLLANLESMPKWVPRKSEPEVPPYFCQIKVFNEQTLPLWEEYCRRMAEHYKGRVDYFEIANEPQMSGTTAEQYVQALRIAYHAIKAVNPRAVVVGMGGMVAGSGLIADSLKLGAGGFCDAISIHGYNLTTWATVDGPETLQRTVRAMRDLLKANGAPENMPIWDSETGWGSPWSYTKFYSGSQVDVPPLDHARMLAKSVAGVKAAGLARVMYYAMFDDNFAQDTHHFRMCSMNDTMRMPMQPMAVAIAMLEGREFVRQDMADKDNGIVHLVFAGRGATVKMMWTPTGTGDVTCPAQAKQVLNMWGREIKPVAGQLKLSSSPIYVVE
ncbi:MAG: hypothetical protein WC058_09735 [Phycisphaeraceae bacterium]